MQKSLLEEHLKELIKKAVMETREEDGLGPHDHYRDHLWIKDQMQKGKKLSELVKRAFINWGIPAAMITFGYGIIELIKMKFGN